MNRYAESKTVLTPSEKLRVAVAVLVRGYDPAIVAELIGCTPALVFEAVMRVRLAIDPAEHEAIDQDFRRQVGGAQ